MDKKDWDNIIKEKVSDELRHKTLVRARIELENSSRPFSLTLKWLVPLIPSLALLLFYFKSSQNKSDDFTLAKTDSFFDELAQLNESELSELDNDLIAELEFYENFDLLEEWDEPSES